MTTLHMRDLAGFPSPSPPSFGCCYGLFSDTLRMICTWRKWAGTAGPSRDDADDREAAQFVTAVRRAMAEVIALARAAAGERAEAAAASPSAADVAKSPMSDGVGRL